jgi:hypothetical protein
MGVAVLGADGLGLGAEVEGVGGIGLHAEGALHRLDAAFEEIRRRERLFVFAVGLLDEVELAALAARSSCLLRR